MGNRAFIIIIIYFENVHFFHAMLELVVCPYEIPPNFPEYRIQDVNQVLPCHHSHTLSKSSHSSPYISPLPPPPFYRPIPIIHTPMLQMPKPPQSATPHHIRHTLGSSQCSFPVYDGEVGVECR